MANPPFTIDIAADTLTPALVALRNKLGDLTPLMAALVLVLDDEVQAAMEAEADPVTGAPWPQLTDDYVARPLAQGGRGGDAHPMLQRDGSLASPDPEHGRDFAQLTFGEVYAAIHQYGGTPDMPPGPAAVPARPFAGVSEGGVQEILDTVEAYLLP